MTRVRVDVAAAKPGMRWGDVHGAARGILYKVIAASDPDLATELHDRGWHGSTIRPVGISPPVFAEMAKRKGSYATPGNGSVWFGSSVPEIATAIVKGLSSITELHWGGVPLAIQGKSLEWPSDFSAGMAEFSSVSPVLVKAGKRFLLPHEDGYVELLTHNLRHKADVLKLPNEVKLEVLKSGPKRISEVARSMRIGASARIRVIADPALLGALHECGIGLNTVQGFGWLR